MFCRKCGAENQEDAIQCSACGESFVKNNEDFLKKAEPVNKTEEQIPQQPVQTPVQQYVPQQDAQQPAYAKPVSNNMVYSILITVFGALSCCCLNPASLPLGIIAIVYSNQVDQKVRMGDIEGAKKSARTAKILNWVGFGLIMLALVVVILFYVIVGYAAIKSDASNYSSWN